MRHILVLLLIVLVLILPCSTNYVLADNPSVTLTVTAEPIVVGDCVSNLVVIYISDTNLNLSWVLGNNITNVMIRGKYGGYPEDIPDKNTAPSDGYLVFYGNGVSANDTTMNFDVNPGPIYYKAWGQRADGTWQVNNPANIFQESKEMVLIGIIVLCAVVTYFSLRGSNILLALGGAISWIMLLVYTRTAPIGGVAVGSFLDELTIFLCVVFAAVLLIMAVTRSRRERGYNGIRPEWGESREIKQSPRKTMPTGLMDMNNTEYRQEIKSRVRQRRR